MKRKIIVLTTVIAASLAVDSIFHSAGSQSISTLPKIASTSVPAYSNSPKLNTHLFPETVGKRALVLAQASSSLLGYWVNGGAREQQIDFFSDGSYRYVILVSGTGVHSYNMYGKTITVGTFEVHGNTLILHP